MYEKFVNVLEEESKNKEKQGGEWRGNTNANLAIIHKQHLQGGIVRISFSSSVWFTTSSIWKFNYGIK